MPSNFIRLPKPLEMYDYRNEAETRRLIELALQQQVPTPEDDDEDDDAPVGGSVPNEEIPMSASWGHHIELTELPADETYWNLFKRAWYDCTLYTHVRIVADIYVAGSSGSKLWLQFSPTPDDDDSWETVGLTDDCELSLATVGARRGMYVQMRPEAVDDNCWRLVTIGGDDSSSPVVGYIAIEFSVRDVVPFDRWYLRKEVPLYQDLYADGFSPQSIPVWGDLTIMNFWNSNPRNAGGSYASPTSGEAQADYRSLLRQKGSGVLTADTIHALAQMPATGRDQSGLIGMWVSPPLAAGTLPGVAVSVNFTGTCQNGAAAGYMNFWLSVHRPGVGCIATWSTVPSAITSKWFRYFAKDRSVGINITNDVDLLDNDRLVLEGVATSVTIGFVLLDTMILFEYGGAEDSFTDGADSGKAFPAPYITLPPLNLLSDIA